MFAHIYKPVEVQAETAFSIRRRLVCFVSPLQQMFLTLIQLYGGSFFLNHVLCSLEEHDEFVPFKLQRGLLLSPELLRSLSASVLICCCDREPLTK